jgi:nickel-dependent lactate racemase
MDLLRVEYGDTYISLKVPLSVDERGMAAAPVIEDPSAAVTDSFENPIGTQPLREIIRSKLAAKPDAGAVVVVSDYTRPVPYRGRGGILAPLLRTMVQSGLTEDRITILIGCGSHRNMEEKEIENMLGLKESGFNPAVINHEYDNGDELAFVGRTERNSPVEINKKYCEADIKIVTGLVESHFMAGASGGRKAVCPGVAGKKTLDGNPCHEEALQAARLAGCDFSVNVTLDSARRHTGVFSGELGLAHLRAVEKIREYVVVGIEKKYDLVIIPAGFVGVNHYQAVKAAVAASRAVRPGGMIILIAKHTDPDPVGSTEYRETLALLKERGPAGFLKTINSPEWTFRHDQWETQMWGKVLSVIGSETNLLYCSLEISDDDYRMLPCNPAVRLLGNPATEKYCGTKRPGEPTRVMEEMAREAVRYAIDRLKSEADRSPAVLFLRDGPYGVPEVSSLRTKKAGT